MPEDAAVGRKLSFSWPEQRQGLKTLLSAAYCSLVQTTLPTPTACSGGSSSRQAAQGVSQEAFVLRASWVMGCERLAGVFRSWVCSVVKDGAVLSLTACDSTEPTPTFSLWVLVGHHALGAWSCFFIG